MTKAKRALTCIRSLDWIYRGAFGGRRLLRFRTIRLSYGHVVTMLDEVGITLDQGRRIMRALRRNSIECELVPRRSSSFIFHNRYHVLIK